MARLLDELREAGAEQQVTAVAVAAADGVAEFGALLTGLALPGTVAAGAMLAPPGSNGTSVLLTWVPK